MKKYLLTLIFLLVTIFCCSVWADRILELTWDDLIPAHLLAEDPMAKYTPEQQDMVYWVINILETLPERTPETEEYYKEVDEALPTLKKAGIDIKELLAKRKQIRTSVVEKLNDQTVRIPGYLLPIEVSKGKVTEFLLVPYVGACIHVPPPPPNQIIHVNYTQKEGYKSSKLFEPVWVNGKIAVKSVTQELFLVDGSAEIAIGYTMQANRIEPFKE
jgi:hypothetical protein